MVHRKCNIALVLIVLFFCVGSSSFAATALRQKMDTYLQAWTAEDLFSGAVLIAKDGEIIFHKAMKLLWRCCSIIVPGLWTIRHFRISTPGGEPSYVRLKRRSRHSRIFPWNFRRARSLNTVIPIIFCSDSSLKK